MTGRQEPGELLDAARRYEAGLRLTQRTAALDAIAGLLRSDVPPPTVNGRNWALELDAERAIDLARLVEVDAAQALAERVLATAGPQEQVARARATEALGRALAWSGTDGRTRTAEAVLLDAVDLYEALGEHEWQGYALFWLGNSVHFQNGDLDGAESYIRAGLDLLGPESARRPAVLTFLANVLVARGDWSGAEAVLDEAARLAVDAPDPMSRAYVAWSRAQVASGQGNAAATERNLREAEREAGDWLDIHTGATFFADAAELLDRVGEPAAADAYLARAVERLPEDEFVRQAQAALLARRGDPELALVALQELTRGEWLEKRLIWRHSLLAAYASLRAGRDDVGVLAARALDQAAAAGGLDVAIRGEPALVAAVLPLAEAAGSGHARALLAPSDGIVVRLFGATSVIRGDGLLTLPPGQSSELVRMLALHPNGMTVEQVIDAFFPDVSVDVGRHRVRQILTRLRAAVGDVVLRDGEHLHLAPAWVDVRAFRLICDRALKARPEQVAELAYSALALWTGPPLPADAYAGWASSARRQLHRRYLDLLDLLAADAARRGSIDEALHALTLAREEDPYDESLYVRAAAHLIVAGRHGAARRLARDAADVFSEISVALPQELLDLLRDA
jgi:DNA-binding SARP family transcriptional activator